MIHLRYFIRFLSDVYKNMKCQCDSKMDKTRNSTVRLTWPRYCSYSIDRHESMWCIQFETREKRNCIYGRGTLADFKMLQA